MDYEKIETIEKELDRVKMYEVKKDHIFTYLCSFFSHVCTCVENRMVSWEWCEMVSVGRWGRNVVWG